MTRIFAIAAFALLGACTSQTGQPLSPAATVFAAKTAYQAPLELAVAYNKRPPCVAAAPVLLCRDAAVVAQLRKANDAALASLDAAEHVSRTPGVNQSAVTLALATADNAVKAFAAIVTIYK